MPIEQLIKINLPWEFFDKNQLQNKTTQCRSELSRRGVFSMSVQYRVPSIGNWDRY